MLCFLSQNFLITVCLKSECEMAEECLAVVLCRRRRYREVTSLQWLWSLWVYRALVTTDDTWGLLQSRFMRTICSPSIPDGPGPSLYPHFLHSYPGSDGFPRAIRTPSHCSLLMSICPIHLKVILVDVLLCKLVLQTPLHHYVENCSGASARHPVIQCIVLLFPLKDLNKHTVGLTIYKQYFIHQSILYNVTSIKCM